MPTVVSSLVTMSFKRAVLGPVLRPHRPDQSQFLVFSVPLEEITQLTRNFGNAVHYLPNESQGLPESPVHRSMRRTLARMPERFYESHDGLTVLTCGCLIHSLAEALTLTDPVLLDGAQTVGVVENIQRAGGIIPLEAWVRLKVLEVSPKHHAAMFNAPYCGCETCNRLIGEGGSDLSRHVHLMELETSLQERWPGISLGSRAEWLTSGAGDPDGVEAVYCTDRLLRLLYLCLPQSAWPMNQPLDRPLAYSFAHNLAGTRQEEAWPFWEHPFRFITDHLDRPDGVGQFHLDAAADVLALERRWHSHPMLLDALSRTQSRSGTSFESVPDGVLFPVLAALAERGAHQVGDSERELRWVVREPAGLDAAAFAHCAADLLTKMAGGAVDQMGRCASCYRILARWVQTSTSGPAKP